jgi:hypothetical protein
VHERGHTGVVGSTARVSRDGPRRLSRSIFQGAIAAPANAFVACPSAAPLRGSDACLRELVGGTERKVPRASVAVVRQPISAAGDFVDA